MNHTASQAEVARFRKQSECTEVHSRSVNGDSVTLSFSTSDAAPADATVIPYLVVLLEGRRPRALSSRHLLADTRIVKIGRGPARQCERSAIDRSLSIAVPDQWMSSQHARLTNQFGRWFLEDANSKNGTLYQGAPISQVRLRDGDIFFAGRTLFLFRCEALVPEATASDSNAGDQIGKLTTLSPTLGFELDQLRQIAESTLSILLSGETGTGKVILARTIHKISGQSGPFVVVNSNSLTTHLGDADLLTLMGQVIDDPGMGREQLANGTLFLDEIADLSDQAQATLLRLLRESENVTSQNRATNDTLPPPAPGGLRILAATHKDLRARIAGGLFRRDLFARLAGYEFRLPALRDRREDMGVLFATLFDKHSGGKKHPGITPLAAQAMLEYNWPLNIREFDNCIASALALSPQAVIEISHLPSAVRAGPVAPDEIGSPNRELSTKDQQLRDQLMTILTENGGNISATARKLGKDRKQIQRWLKRLGIDAMAFRDDAH